MKPWHGIAGALLAVLSGTGCGPAEAQEEKARWEHAVLEWVHYRSATEEHERYSWATAAQEIQRDTAAGLFDALALDAPRVGSAADRLRVLDHLSGSGWQLVNRTDVAYTDAGGSAIAERYVLRRRRG